MNARRLVLVTRDEERTMERNQAYLDGCNDVHAQYAGWARAMAWAGALFIAGCVLFCLAVVP